MKATTPCGAAHCNVLLCVAAAGTQDCYNWCHEVRARWSQQATALVFGQRWVFVSLLEAGLNSCWGHFTWELIITSSSQGNTNYWLYWTKWPPKRFFLLSVYTNLFQKWVKKKVKIIFIVCHFCHGGMIFEFVIKMCWACVCSPVCRLWTWAGHHRPSGQESRTLHLWLCGHLSCCCSQVHQHSLELCE